MKLDRSIKDVLADSSLNPTEKVILTSMLLKSTKEMQCSVSLTELSKANTFSRSTLWGNLKNLKQKGQIEMYEAKSHNEKAIYSLTVTQKQNLAVPPKRNTPPELSITERSVCSPKPPTAEAEALLNTVMTAFSQTLPELEKPIKKAKNDIEKFALLLQKIPHLQTAEWWQEYFQKIKMSQWLMGKNPQNWKPTFDFLIKEKTIAKIEAGGYGLKNVLAPPKESAEEYAERLYERLFGKESIKDEEGK